MTTGISDHVTGPATRDRQTEADGQRHAGAVDQAGQQVAPDMVGAEQVAGRGAGEAGGCRPEVGAVLLRAVEAALEQVPASEAGDRDEADAETTMAQRRADALGLVAEGALAGGLDPGNSADRIQVTVHVQAGTLAPREPDIGAPRTSADTPTPGPAASVPSPAVAGTTPQASAEAREVEPAALEAHVSAGTSDANSTAPVPAGPALILA